MILGIDQGTTGTTCLVLDEHARVVGRAAREHEQHFPRPGWVEHDADEIWDNVQATALAALEDAGADPGSLEAIGITNQRETALAWDRDSGEPLARALVWQDRRTAERCDELREQGHEQTFRERTGLVLDSYFSGTKWEWLLTEGGVDPQRAALGTMDSWLVHKLCGLHATDHSNASRTLVFDIHERSFDPELCELLRSRPRRCRSRCRARTSTARPTCSAAAVRSPWPASPATSRPRSSGRAATPGRRQEHLWDRLVRAPEHRLRAPPLAHGLLSTLAWTIGEERTDYAVEASIFVTGAAVQWLRDGLGIIEEAGETEALAASLESNDGVYFVPALTGLASPHWDPYARGTIVGLTRGNDRSHLARAALEAIAYQTVDAVRAMEDASGEPLEELRADGGAVANAWLMQFQADVLGVPVVVPETIETTALGAACLAGVAVGTWTEQDVRELWREAARYEPSMSEDERESLLAGWRAALGRAKGDRKS